MLKVVAKVKDRFYGYVEVLYKTEKRYYRIKRNSRYDWYLIYANDSEYGQPQYDYIMDINHKTVREKTIKDCQESIKIYDMLN